MIASSFNGRIDIYQKVSKTADSMGAQTFTWQKLYNQIPARVQQIAADKIVRIGVDRIFASHNITVETKWAITAEHKIVYSGKNYLVASVNDWNNEGIYLEVAVIEERGQ